MSGASVFRVPTWKHGDILLSLLIIALSTSNSCSRGYCTGEAINYLPAPPTTRWSVFPSSVVTSYWPLAFFFFFLKTLPMASLVSSELSPGQFWRRTHPQVQTIHFWVWTSRLQISDLTSHWHLRPKASDDAPVHYSLLSTRRASAG